MKYFVKFYPFFISVIYKFLYQVRVFIPGKPYQPNQRLVGKAVSLFLCGAPSKRFFIWVGSGLNCKH